MSRILLVDDDASLLELLGRRISDAGHEVHRFSDPGEALAAVPVLDPDVVLSDVQMPGMTGLELVELARWSGCLVPFVLMTGDLTDEVEARASELGVQHVFTKPVRDFDNFLAAIQSVSIGCGEYDDDLRETAMDEVDILTQLAHDIRTPLTAVSAALDGLVHERSALSEEDARLVSIGKRNLRRLSEAIEKHLDVLRRATRERQPS